MSERRIAHLDMDAFFASVELLRRPQLRGRPLAIGGSEAADTPAARARLAASRGVLTTATYEARAFGVHSGMPIRQALRLCPELILLPVDFVAYRHYSRLFKAAVREICPLIEDRGIDEIYLDLSELPGDARALAATLKLAVRAATGLSCSVGIAPNKLLAKIASDLDKPDGITILRQGEVPARIWPLPVRRINGIGPKAQARLAELGITRIGELAAASPALLAQHFGRNYGGWLYAAAHGRDERALEIHQEPKSRSREITFPHDTRDPLTLATVLVKLSRQVSLDLAARGYGGRTVGVKVRYDNFELLTRDHTLASPTASFERIRDTAYECLRRVPMQRRLRLLGVRVGALQPLPAGAEPAGPAPGESGRLFD